MTAFVKENFHYFGKFLTYNNRFVARFKHRGPVSKAAFLKELIKHHTVEEYFSILENKDFAQRRAPLEILRDRNPQWYQGLVQKFQAKFV